MSKNDKITLKSRGKKPLGSLNKALEEQVRGAPKAYLTRRLARVISEKAPEASTDLVDALASHIATSPGEDFSWDDGKADGSSIHIDLTVDDVRKAFEETIQFSENELPKIIQGCVKSSADVILKSLRADWPNQRAYDQARMAQFQYNLMDRWGDAFDTLRMMYTIAVEIGSEIAIARRRSRSKKDPMLRDTVTQLHARACQVVLEIITLMENGFADGAMARWRTLHEITVVAALLDAHGEELPKRYRAHEAIEAKRAMDRFKLHHAQLGYAAPKRKEIESLEEDYTNCLQLYGDNFGSEYGWAAHHLQMRKPRLVDLEAAVGQAPMHSYYRMASYNVHAGARGIGFRLGLMDGEGMPTALAGASNAGFLDPGQNTAYDLAHVTSLLASGTHRFDRMIEWQILSKLRDEALRKLGRAQKQLDRAHRAQLKMERQAQLDAAERKQARLLRSEAPQKE